MPVCNNDIHACISLLVVNIKARGGTASKGTRRGATIRCLASRRQIETATWRQRDRSRDNTAVNSASSLARGQRRIANPPDCTCAKAIDNVTTDRIAGNRRACTRVALLTRIRDVNSAADETISRRSRANRGGTRGVSGAMYRQMSVYG